MNDLFFKFIEKLALIDNTALFAVSIIPYLIFLFYLYKIKTINVFVKTGFSLTVLFDTNIVMNTNKTVKENPVFIKILTDLILYK